MPAEAGLTWCPCLPSKMMDDQLAAGVLPDLLKLQQLDCHDIEAIGPILDHLEKACPEQPDPRRSCSPTETCGAHCGSQEQMHGQSPAAADQTPAPSHSSSLRQSPSETVPADAPVAARQTPARSRCSSSRQECPPGTVTLEALIAEQPPAAPSQPNLTLPAASCSSAAAAAQTGGLLSNCNDSWACSPRQANVASPAETAIDPGTRRPSSATATASLGQHGCSIPDGASAQHWPEVAMPPATSDQAASDPWGGHWPGGASRHWQGSDMSLVQLLQMPVNEACDALRDYLIAATAKDCSLMLCMQRLLSPEHLTAAAHSQTVTAEASSHLDQMREQQSCRPETLAAESSCQCFQGGTAHAAAGSCCYEGTQQSAGSSRQSQHENQSTSGDGVPAAATNLWEPSMSGRPSSSRLHSEFPGLAGCCKTASGRCYGYNLVVVDLDRKAVAKIPKHHALEEEIMQAARDRNGTQRQQTA